MSYSSNKKSKRILAFSLAIYLFVSIIIILALMPIYNLQMQQTPPYSFCFSFDSFSLPPSSYNWMQSSEEGLANSPSLRYLALYKRDSRTSPFNLTMNTFFIGCLFYAFVFPIFLKTGANNIKIIAITQKKDGKKRLLLS